MDCFGTHNVIIYLSLSFWHCSFFVGSNQAYYRVIQGHDIGASIEDRLITLANGLRNWLGQPVCTLNIYHGVKYRPKTLTKSLVCFERTTPMN